MDIQQENAIKILTAWHLIEFFQTYSVPDKADNEITPVNVSRHELETYRDGLLPWFSRASQQKLGLDLQKVTTYTLYLGLCEKSLFTDIVDKYFSGQPAVVYPEDEIEQRLDKEGWTCFAKLQLDEHGKPDKDSFSVSSLPWAIGMLLKGNAAEISQEAFDADCDRLSEYWDRWESVLPVSQIDAKKKVVNANRLIHLIDTLYKWARLDRTVLQRMLNTTEYSFRMAFFQKTPKDDPHTDDPADDDETEKTEMQMPILNSFYLRDLERAINSISSGRAGTGLVQYLSQQSERHTDLYTNQALELIQQSLEPDKTPEGRWPSDPKFNMSLMQQFAVNTALQELKHCGLMSVNGPPGTGKTTLLRDVIAHNIVERAKVLASLPYAGAGIQSDGSLIPDLTGFEMVVASSNNAAVENISKELPCQDAIAEMFSACTYLQPVANQISAEIYNGRLKAIKDPKKHNWGCISAVMGAKKNRKKFIDRFFLFSNYKDQKPDNKPPLKRPPEEDFLNFWQFKDQYKGPGFYEAKKAFTNALTEFHRVNQGLIDIAALRKKLAERNFSDEIESLFKCLMNRQQLLCYFITEKDEITRQCDSLRSEEETEALALERIRLDMPGFFAKLFNTQKNKYYKLSLQEQLNRLEMIKRRFHENQQALSEKERVCDLRQRECQNMTVHLEQLKTEFDMLKTRLQKYESEYQQYHLPESQDQIDDDERQRHAYWQHSPINEIRSKLFCAAMTLHEAWLIDAQRNDSFRNNIFKIKDIVLGHKKNVQAQTIWQILFMFIPVISTTFASLGNMFSQLKEESIGWLMVDEAGQAIPQSVIGGVWRAKRALIVGDPLQIEPVFTSSPQLVEHLMTAVLGTKQENWTPLKWSVQQLADRVNPYGCYLEVMGEQKWIGIPLWVHRRCIDPMFSIANRIAYNNRMIHGFADKNNVPRAVHAMWGPSQWIQTKGVCSYKQYSPELGNTVVNILMELKEAGGSIKEIYIISPFKAVKEQLKREIRAASADLVQILNCKQNEISEFISKNIGTVHTFQGKENDAVIFVLGCDQSNSGGAGWAASKPNLLNVAVTRAKKHLYIVGDQTLWSGKTYFKDAYQAMPEMI